MEMTALMLSRLRSAFTVRATLGALNLQSLLMFTSTPRAFEREVRTCWQLRFF
ncbi:hypothetical protein AAHK20_33160 [Trinickia sp. YCB016]